MIFKISGMTWGIVSLSPVICGSNRCVPPPIQTRLTDCPRCIYSCILGYSRCLSLFKFFTVNDSNHSTVCWSFCGSVLPMLILGSNTFAKNNFVSEKKLFLAFYELHDNMKAWTDLLNNRTRRQNGQNNWTKNAKQPPLRTPQTFLNNLSKSHNFVTFIVVFF